MIHYVLLLALLTGFQEDSCSLKEVQGIPLLILEGSPERMGEAHGRLLAEECRALMDSYLKPAAIMSGGLLAMEKRALKMKSHVPERYLKELEAMAKAVDVDFSFLLTGNAFPDIYRGGGCSTLAAAGEASKEGEPLLGRNLDFFSMGVLDKCGLLIIFKPQGYHRFASVTWPALNGVLSAMNEKGLCCAVMEVRNGRRDFNGMPSTYLFRRVMEEASTVEEALKILESANKVASNNLILLDRSGVSAVAEIGPGHFAARMAEQGAVAGTNHHRIGTKTAFECHRYEKLMKYVDENRGAVDVEGMKQVLNRVNQGMLTVQSMVFEPRTLTLHLSMGKIPATRGEYKTLCLAEYLGGNKDP
jgi:predicted choloylglycine hydrolase